MMATSGMLEPSVSRYGLSQVYAPQGGGHVDVVFVHGLNGDPHNSWTSEKSKIFWPEQLLPPILEEERARILVYGYDADVTSFTDGTSRDKIHNHAEHLIAELAANRRIRKATERPIIFVAHSLGGLVVKRALIYSSEIRGNYTEHLRSIFVSTYGILFLGTPHRGSDLAKWGSRLEAICRTVMPSKIVDTNENLVNALKTNNETLQNIDRQFIQLISRFHVYFFHEGKPTNLKAGLEFIVDEDSAAPNVQDVERAVIQADHSHMCKFENDSAPGFALVAEGIQRFSGEAPATITARWDSEKAERIAKKKAEVEEILPGSMKRSPNTESTTTTPGKEQLALPAPEIDPFSYEVEEVEEPAERVKETRGFAVHMADFGVTVDTSQILPPRAEMKDDATNTPAASLKPADPYFIVPPGFRPNTFFVGMDKELQELDRRLFSKRRRDGTACVLLHGQPGAGKSHLARQYVISANKNRQKFIGGIFWISAKSKEEMYHAFWNIKQKVVARDSPDLCDGVNGRDYVQLVKAWFEGRHEWLIVFDGVSVEKDEDSADLSEFIPDSKDSSMIYISRAKNLESDQRLLRPIPIKVGPLKEDDAKKLLFKELHIKKPTESEVKKAMELVRKIGGLPLAINAISHRLADTHEPLTKYKLSYSADPTIEGTYNKILDDLQRLGHMEAWNLINIICWFAQDLPFEMVHLGLKILRAEKVEVRATEGTGKPEIDNTIATLMRYALIERNEPNDKDSMSSSRDSLNEPEPIDMLKIHSVVQNFCCEQLNARGMLPLWLGYAIKLFSYSFHQADVRIKSKPEPGRVSDYRYYETHGKWLWNHTMHYESKTRPLDDIRALLLPTIRRITEEIQSREPNSSQESLQHGIFQISIFDRTSSSSDSGPIGPATPDHRPTPPPLANQNDFGFPLGKEIDSPGSFGTASPDSRTLPKILGNSPRLPDYDDIGYDSDREGHHTPSLMQRDLSEMTARPSPRSRAPTTESHEGEWQVVKNPRKQPRRHRDLGSFRRTLSPAQVTRQTVEASMPRSEDQRQENRRGSSPAFKSLEKVQSRSPPPSRAGLASTFQREPISRPPAMDPSQTTWAGIATGKVGQATQQTPTASTSRQIGPSPSPMLLDRGRPRESPQTRPGTAQHSPLASEYLPGASRIEDSRTGSALPSLSSEYPPAGFRYNMPYPGYNPDLTPIPQGRPIIDNPSPYYTPPPLLGPNPEPLPVDINISLTSKRPLPQDFRNDQQSAYTTPPSQQPSPPSRTSPYQQLYGTPYPPPVMPTGYSSQPMSRNQSHLSHDSIADTDPIRYPSAFSPQLMPTLVPDSPRERHSDGRPFRKSPKTDYAIPAYQPNHHRSSSSQVSPYDLSHTGGWAYPGPPSNAPYSTNMSRESSGPGVAVEGTPGGIVGFNANPDSLQFGDHPPISVEEGRRRILEHEQWLRETQRESVARGRGEEEEGRRESAPYPENNLIPTESNSTALEDMVGRAGRRRGLSAPEKEEVGLGLNLH